MLCSSGIAPPRGCRSSSITLAAVQKSGATSLVERWFAILSQRQIKRGSHRSTLELEKAIRNFLDVHNQDPKPFVWHKTADEIIESVGRFCTRINASVH
jgi:hypothetical protein